MEKQLHSTPLFPADGHELRSAAAPAGEKLRHLRGKQIVYDGACPLCVSLHSFVTRRGILPSEKLSSWYDLPPAQQLRVDPDRFRNEMALIDLQGGVTMYGPEALEYIFAGKYAWVRRLFRLPGVRPLAGFVYRVIGANRYQIADPDPAVPACTCAPDRPLGLRLWYIAWCLLWAIGITAGFGAGLAQYFSAISPAEAALQMLLIVGSGWGLQFLIAAALRGKRLHDYPEHLATIMRKGVMILLPATVLMAVLPATPVWIPIVSVLLSSIRMSLQHYRRSRAIGHSAAWTTLWLLSLYTGAAYWIFYFHVI